MDRTRLCVTRKTRTRSTSSTPGVLPPLEITARTPAGLGTRRSTLLQGRDIQIEQRAPFAVPGGEGAELTATLSPVGSAPDRRLYLAILKGPADAKLTLVIYGNTVSMFDNGLADATAFAHRIHFLGPNGVGSSTR